MKKIIASVAAAGVLVTGAFTASTLLSAPAGAQALDAVVDDPMGADETGPREEALDEVLAGLVADDVLSQGQADEVKARLVAKHEELAAERRERREERRAVREQIRGFLEDDVITADELAQLPEDHPMRNEDGVFGDALADGQITREELRELRMEHMDGWRRGIGGAGVNA
jgi:hypothetical protein